MAKMNPSTELCRFIDPEIDRLYTCFPSGTIFFPFDASTKSDFVSPIWVCFPDIPFQIGYIYPFPEFTLRFFTLTGMCYSQAMPMLWGVYFTFVYHLGCVCVYCFKGYSCVYSTMLFGYHLFYDWWIPVTISVVSIVCLMFGFESGVFLEEASLFIWIEVRFVYIPPSPGPTNSFVICGTCWVLLLLLLLLYAVNSFTSLAKLPGT
ncbi:hypothetical protein Hanom_Chr01g00034151 [Helianthus anomalus]